MKEAIRTFKETVEIRSSWLNRLRRHRYFPIVLLVCAVLGAACIHVWQRVQVMQLVQEVSRLEKQNAVLRDDVKKGRAEVTALSMATRIEQYAVDSLGMAPVSADRLFTLVREKSDPARPDDLNRVLAAMQRIAKHLPVIEENQAYALPARTLTIDSSSSSGDLR